MEEKVNQIENVASSDKIAKITIDAEGKELKYKLI